MQYSSSEDWHVNTGNNTVSSELLEVTKASEHGPTQHKYSNHTVLPYVGRDGWVIEYPDYDPMDKQGNPIILKWIPCTTRPTLLCKLLRGDHGLYRARWTAPSTVNGRAVLYPDAEVHEEDFRWSYEQIKTVLQTSANNWVIERMEVVHNRIEWFRTEKPEWNCDFPCHRLVES